MEFDGLESRIKQPRSQDLFRLSHGHSDSVLPAGLQPRSFYPFVLGNTRGDETQVC